MTHKEHELTLLNRGNIKTGLSDVTELVCDRHDRDGLKALLQPTADYDVVVDFCAYEKGDIDSMIDSLKGDKLPRYLFISTVDVYKKGNAEPVKEDSALADEYGEGPQADYIRGKVTLEHELMEAHHKLGMKTVSVRPCVLYGPLNYAPREKIYFEWIKKAGQIVHPTDADGYWQMIYAGDAARALKKLCELPDEEICEAYNFCTPDRITYDVFEEALKSLGVPFEKADISVSEAEAGNIPLPFPLEAEGSAFYSAERYESLLREHTPLEEGLARSFTVHFS